MVIESGGLSPNTARFTASRDPAALADRGKGGLKYLYTDAFNEAKKTAGLTLIKMLVTGLVMVLLAGTIVKIKLFGGAQ